MWAVWLHISEGTPVYLQMWHTNKEDSGPCPQRREALVGGQRQVSAARGVAAGAEGQGGWWRRRRLADGYTAADLSSCWK